MRIAIIGGADYDETAFEDFLYKLSNKYPDAVIVTGTAAGKNLYSEELNDKGKKQLLRAIPSAERAAQSLLTGLGHTVEIPEPCPYLSTIMSGSDLQISDAINGTMRVWRPKDGKTQHRLITPRADIIVTVGNPESARAKQAADIWKKLDAWRLEEFRRPLHNVAAPPTKKKAAARKPTKKKELLAV